MSDTAETDLVDVNAVALHLDVSARTVYEWVATGRFPARRLGNILRFSLAEVDAWVEARRIGPRV